jgi:hypothetical protein
MSKSELPQSRLGFVGERHPKLPMPLEPPPVLAENVELKSSVECCKSVVGGHAAAAVVEIGSW